MEAFPQVTAVLSHPRTPACTPCSLVPYRDSSKSPICLSHLGFICICFTHTVSHHFCLIPPFSATLSRPRNQLQIPPFHGSSAFYYLLDVLQIL